MSSMKLLAQQNLLRGCFPRPLTDTLNYSQGGNWIRPVLCQTGPASRRALLMGLLDWSLSGNSRRLDDVVGADGV